ncbi:hypothetical protein [Moraxella oblonga]|uniref:hypothetical protein n=1 Tax=Moraxella oblonga TaxID=200413 RepID=UPI00082A5165|nr:hypothetical protein [Moraxella oblonga]
MDYVKLAIVGATVSLLSGCLATSALQSQYSEEKYDFGKAMFEDKIYALGTPKQPIKNYPLALVAVGDKYDYILQGDYQEESKPYQIFTSLDTNHLFFSNDDTNPFDNLNKDKTSLIKAGMARSAYSDRSAINQAKKYGLDTKGTIHFIKPKQQVTSQELAKLSTLSFTCNDKTVQNMTYTHCHYKTGLTFTPINKTIDVNTLEHRFPTPYGLRYG